MLKPNFILLDADIVVYRAGFSAQTTEVFENIISKYELIQPYNQEEIKIRSKVTVAKPERYAIAACNAIIKSIQKELNITNYHAFLTGTNNYRLQIKGNKEYKGNRKDFVKPIHYDAVRNHLIKNPDVTIVDNEEADDALGIAQFKTKHPEYFTTVIVSIDKDLLQIPGWHYNLNTKQLIYSEDPGKLVLSKDAKGRYHLTGYGFKWFCAQMLLGDVADNIEGIHKLGPKRVFDLLDPIYHEADLWQEIVLEYYNHGKSPVNLLGTADLLWIRRNRDQLFSRDAIAVNEPKYPLKQSFIDELHPNLLLKREIE